MLNTIDNGCNVKSSLKLQDLNDLLRGTNSVSEVLTRNSFFWLDQGINMAARAILFFFFFFGLAPMGPRASSA
jgi:hypothetical protein